MIGYRAWVIGVLPSISVLYMGYRYGWGTTGIGLVMAGISVPAMIVQGGLIGPVTMGRSVFPSTASRRRGGSSASVFP
jgi:hypothetical protein